MTRSTGRLAIIAAVGLLAGCSQAPADLPYGTAQQFMANEVQPTAEIYWNSVGAVSELVDGEPVFREFQPETDEEWAAVAAAAAKLREHGEILAGPYAEGRGEDWLDFSRGLQDMATAAEQAAQSKDPEAVFTAGGNLYNVCTACHQSYPPADMPQDGAAEPASPAAAG